MEFTSVNTSTVHKFLYNYKVSGSYYLVPKQPSKEGSGNFPSPCLTLSKILSLKTIPIASLTISKILFVKSLNESITQAPGNSKFGVRERTIEIAGPEFPQNVLCGSLVLREKTEKKIWCNMFGGSWLLL